MKGLTLSRQYYEQYGRPMLQTKFASVYEQACVGLVGQGSECFGFDDEISQDHDFGPGFCVWLPQQTARDIASEFERAYQSLPATFMGITRHETAQAGRRVGLFSIEEFYSVYLNRPCTPSTPMEWLEIPEHHLATAINGEVFEDNLGRFSQIRSELNAFYPSDVVKKKLAAYFAQMAQSGQYNLPRALKRGCPVTLLAVRAKFLEAAFGALFLLARSYMPFYKWRFRALSELSCYPYQLLDDVRRFATTQDDAELAAIAECICVYTLRCAHAHGWVRTHETFLQVAAEEIQQSISSEQLRSLHLLKGGASLS